MTRVTDLMNDHRAAFEQLLDTVTVRHYIASGSADDYGDTEAAEHPDSPVDAPGYVQRDGTPSVDRRPSGVEREGDATIYIDADVFVTDGGEPWASSSQPSTDVVYSEVTDVDGTVYRVVSADEMRGGFTECRGKAERP
jgi:hypothetical protein